MRQFLSTSTKHRRRALRAEQLEGRLLLAAVTDSLQDRIQQHLDVSSGRAGVAILNENTNDLTTINGNAVFGTSSTIKVGILYALLRRIDADPAVSLSTTLNSGAQYGNNQASTIAANTNYTLQFLADTMIDNSNNWATNRLMDFVGINAVNQELQALGLTQTILDRYMTGTGAPSAHATTGPGGDYRAGFDNETTPLEMISLLEQIDDNNGLLTASSYNAFWNTLGLNASGLDAGQFYDDSIYAEGGWDSIIDFYSKNGSNSWTGSPGDFVDDPAIGNHFQKSVVGRMLLDNGETVFFAMFVDEASNESQAEQALGAGGYEIAAEFADAPVTHTPDEARLDDGYVLTVTGTDQGDLLEILPDGNDQDIYGIAVNDPGDALYTVDLQVKGVNRARVFAKGGADTVIISGALLDPAMAALTIDGGTGIDMLNVSSNAPARELSNFSYSTSAGESFALASLENAILNGGDGDNGFTVSDWDGKVELNGFAGADTFNIDTAGQGAVGGPVIVNGGDGTIDKLVLDGGSTSFKVANTAPGDGSLTGLPGAPTITFSGLEQIEPPDLGDAPDSYGTLLGSNGARHFAGSGLILGAALDVGPNGQPSATALGDDTDFGDDEEGVVIPASLISRVEARIDVTASAAGHLDAWIDYNRNGRFETAEQIAVSLAVSAGLNSLVISVPATAVEGASYARFRLSSAGGLAPTGAAADGEVEDYPVQLVVPAPGTAGVFDDPKNSGHGVLVVRGRSISETIVVEPAPGQPAAIKVTITPNLVTRTLLRSSFERVVVFGDAGNDTIVIGARLATSASLYGDSGKDVLVGAQGADLLFGGDGHDVLVGKRGNDRLLGGEGKDTLAGGDGADLLDGEGGVDTLSGDAGADILLGGADTDYLFGGLGSDLLIGGLGRDVLSGQQGDDLLIGSSTVHDGDVSTLLFILSQWNSGQSFASRLTALAGLLKAGSAVEDAAKDTLYGNAGRDWFLTSLLPDSLPDFFNHATRGDKKN